MHDYRHYKSYYERKLMSRLKDAVTQLINGIYMFKVIF